MSESKPLASLGGAPPPPALRDDLEPIAALPAQARPAFWSVLSSSLPDPMPESAEARLTHFTSQLGLEMEHVAKLVGACRFVYREAAKRGIPKDTFASDLRDAAIGAAASELLVAHYDEARAIIARDTLVATLADHGKLLTGVASRLDTVGPSDRGIGSDSPVGLITLRLQEGDAEARTTFYVIPSVLEELRDACELLLQGMRSRR